MAGHSQQRHPTNIKNMLLSKKRKKPDENLSSSSLESDALLGDILSELKVSIHNADNKYYYQYLVHTSHYTKYKEEQEEVCSLTDVSTIGIDCICSTPGVVVPRRLQVSHDHNSSSHVTPVGQYKDNKVAIAAKSYQYTEVKEPAESNRSVSMDAEDAGHDDMSYDGQYVVIRVC